MICVDLNQQKKQRNSHKTKIGPANIYGHHEKKGVIPPEYENDPELYYAIQASLSDPSQSTGLHDVGLDLDEENLWDVGFS